MPRRGMFQNTALRWVQARWVRAVPTLMIIPPADWPNTRDQPFVGNLGERLGQADSFPGGGSTAGTVRVGTRRSTSVEMDRADTGGTGRNQVVAIVWWPALLQRRWPRPFWVTTPRPSPDKIDNATLAALGSPTCAPLTCAVSDR